MKLKSNINFFFVNFFNLLGSVDKDLQQVDDLKSTKKDGAYILMRNFNNWENKKSDKPTNRAKSRTNRTVGKKTQGLFQSNLSFSVLIVAYCLMKHYFLDDFGVLSGKFVLLGFPMELRLKHENLCKKVKMLSKIFLIFLKLLSFF